MTLLPRLLAAMLLVSTLAGCAILREFQPAVGLQAMTPGEYIALQRGDVLTSGRISAYTAQAIRITGLDQDACASPSVACIEAVAATPGLADERRLSALAELWLQHAISLQGSPPETAGPEQQLHAWMETVRHAWAYLFFTGRTPGDRAFEDRQTQVRDWYNYAVQEVSTLLFEENVDQAGADAALVGSLQRAGWTFHVDLDNMRVPDKVGPARELLPAASLSFTGLRSVWRRDGFGAELVAVMDDAAMAMPEQEETPPPAPGRGGHRHRRPPPPAWSEMPSPGLTVVFRFVQTSLEAVLAADQVQLEVHDPYASDHIVVNGQRVPLAANFTAGYGLWLARSGFNRESLRTLFGREDGISRPHLYLMQPYDPERRIILMLHGLASSPEAWVNLANEIQGDELLRRNYQIWQVYYPTNMPVVLNHAAIRGLVEDALDHFDPDRSATASQDIVLIGHSMGGLISRLLVSSADEQLWDWFMTGRDIDPARLERIRPRLDPMLRFQPLSEIGRVVFIATPHRGTEVAGNTLGRWISRLVRLPLTVVEGIGEALQLATPAEADGTGNAPGRLSNSIDNLDHNDPFVRAAADLPIAASLPYHSIIARTDPAGPLEQSSDGLVPYASAHLPGALSEDVITSGHSVQQTPQAILEIRRILRLHLEQLRSGSPLEPTGNARDQPGHPVQTDGRERNIRDCTRSLAATCDSRMSVRSGPASSFPAAKPPASPRT